MATATTAIRRFGRRRATPEDLLPDLLGERFADVEQASIDISYHTRRPISPLDTVLMLVGEKLSELVDDVKRNGDGSGDEGDE